MPLASRELDLDHMEHHRTLFMEEKHMISSSLSGETIFHNPLFWDRVLSLEEGKKNKDKGEKKVKNNCTMSKQTLNQTLYIFIARKLQKQPEKQNYRLAHATSR